MRGVSFQWGACFLVIPRGPLALAGLPAWSTHPQVPLTLQPFGDDVGLRKSVGPARLPLQFKSFVALCCARNLILLHGNDMLQTSAVCRTSRSLPLCLHKVIGCYVPDAAQLVPLRTTKVQLVTFQACVAASMQSNFRLTGGLLVSNNRVHGGAYAWRRPVCSRRHHRAVVRAF